MLGRTGMIYGPAGGGKSSLLESAPGTRFLLDTEFRAGDLQGKLVEFNLAGSAIPAYDENTTLVAFVRDVSDLARAVGWIKSGKLKGVRTVEVDSISALQQAAVDATFNGQMRTQDWGTLLRLLSPHLSELVKLAKDPKTEIDLTIFTAWDAEKTLEGEVVGTKPFIQGQLLRRMNHLTDFVWYSTLQRKGTEQVHTLQLDASNTVSAKTGFRGLEAHNGYVKRPNLTTLLSEVKNKGNK